MEALGVIALVAFLAWLGYIGRGSFEGAAFAIAATLLALSFFFGG